MAVQWLNEALCPDNYRDFVVADSLVLLNRQLLVAANRYAPFKKGQTELNFRQQIAKYVTGNVTTDQLPDIAVQGLEEGLDTPSLCILAGLSKNESAFQIEQYFKLTLDELEIVLPDRRKAALEYAIAIVDEILEGKKEIIQGTKEINCNAIDSFDFNSENKKYCFDSIGFEAIYGLFVTHNDLLEADYSWKMFKTNKQLMIEVKAELLVELKKWKEKIENGA